MYYRRLCLIAFGALAVLLLAGCGPRPAGEVGTEIVDAKTALELVDGGAVLVDAQDFLRYRRAHVAGAINIARSDIVVNSPFPGLVAPASQIEDVMGWNGIDADALVVAYDANQNMDAARLWWTLKYYGHDNVKVVSGGLDALEAAGAEITEVMPEPEIATFVASEPRLEMIAAMASVRAQVDDPEPGVVLLDVRTLEEVSEGTIPGSVWLDYIGNNFADGRFRPVQHIRIRHLEQGIDFDDRVIIYCMTSIRAAQTYLALYNAGYRDIELYDGAWVEWSSDPENPVQRPEAPAVQPSVSDNS
jgi:thiosulfate/3-mercaptopyruvate sulfurtransferase